MENITIGIDFGTSNTSIAFMKYNNTWGNYHPECFNLDRRDTIRSLITYKDEDNFWIGSDALIHSYEYPEGFIESLKRQVVNDTLKDKEIYGKSEIDIISDFFMEVIKKIGPEIPYGTKINGVCIGIPIGFKDRDKELYIRAMVRAGIYENYEIASKNTMFVSEPIAAVLNYNISLKDNKRVLVFDFGGGTLDLILVDLKNIKNKNEISPHDVIAKKGNLSLGGDDFDRAILENIVIDKYGITKLKRNLGINRFEEILTVQEGIELMNQIREAKEELSKYEHSSLAFEKGNLKMNLRITREEYELAINQYIIDIRNLVQECLAESGLNSNHVDLVVLSGGSSLTPAVQNLLTDMFGRNKVKVDGDAMTSIARGLALRGQDPDVYKYNDILEHSYGVKIKEEDGKSDTIKVVLRKGSKINIINSEENYQEFELLQETRGKNIFKVKICEDNQEIAVAHIPIKESMKNSKFKLYFSIDEKSERLELHIHDLTWDKKIEVPMEDRFVDINN